MQPASFIPGGAAAPSRSMQERLCMRLDKFLKVSRLIKRRTVANEACDAGRVLINGRTAKASQEVRTGDVLEIAFGNRTLKVEVTDVRENAGKAEASAMYRELP